VTGSVRYGAWGEERASTGTMPTDRGYTGQLEADEVGLYYYNARWYDQELARFVTPDSIVPDPYNLLDWDRYVYARSNPIRYNDPSGYIPCSGDNWDDGPQCLNNPNSDLSSAVVNRHYQQELARSGEARELVTFAAVSTVVLGAAPELLGTQVGGSVAATVEARLLESSTDMYSQFCMPMAHWHGRRDRSSKSKHS